jgi:hypothetical protein
MRELAGEIILVLAITLGLNGLFYFRYTNAGAVIGPAFLTMGLAALMPFVASFKLLKREWSSNTIYLLMSLPVSGTMVLGSKLTALLTQYVIGTLAAGATGYFLLTRVAPEVKALILNQPELITRIYILFVFSFLLLALLVAVSFLSQLVGRLIPRLAALTTAVMFLALLYLLGHVGNSFSQIILSYGTALTMSLYWTGLVMLALIIIIMAGAIYLYDHRVEI